MRRALVLGSFALAACEAERAAPQPVAASASPAEVARVTAAPESPPALPEPAASEPPRASSTAVVAIAVPRFVGSARTADEILERIGNARPVAFRPVGRTSIVFEMRLAGGDSHAAFKPVSRRHPAGYRAEIAAYRVARALGMDQVPPAVWRRLPGALLLERLDPEAAERWPQIEAELVFERDGSLRGAAIHWVSGMRPYALSAADWRRLRHDAPLDPGTQTRDADLSQMIGFDYLIGNWDRFSGGNVSSTAAGDRLYIRDHNLAFAHPLGTRLHERVLEPLRRVERFSRRWIDAVRRLDERRLRAELERDPGWAVDPCLDDARIAALLERRDTLLSWVGSLVEAHGAEATLAFP
ncbi:MAG: hypothetical protein NZ898_13390 [Myxococcota bacterium]|nr:hypothetical protein [Myxococcota bacterium]MDW8363276.1 hypothetical protein [Myxococcales bacterium]